jgi:hypothetical protein
MQSIAAYSAYYQHAVDGKLAYRSSSKRRRPSLGRPQAMQRTAHRAERRFARDDCKKDALSLLHGPVDAGNLMRMKGGMTARDC